MRTISLLYSPMERTNIHVNLNGVVGRPQECTEGRVRFWFRRDRTNPSSEAMWLHVDASFLAERETGTICPSGGVQGYLEPQKEVVRRRRELALVEAQ